MGMRAVAEGMPLCMLVHVSKCTACAGAIMAVPYQVFDDTMDSSRATAVWRRNLTVVWFVQALVTLSASAVFPFIPLFIQELGVNVSGKVVLWSGIAAGAFALPQVFVGPLWGFLADKNGRKRSVFLALYASGLAVSVTGLSANVYHLTAMRFFLGMVAVSFVPSTALVTSSSPRHKLMYSIGVLSTAQFLGITFGPLVGGFLSQALGLRSVFFFAAGVYVLAGVMAQVFLREDFSEGAIVRRRQAISWWKAAWKLGTSREVLAVLAVVALVQGSTVMFVPALPVTIASIQPGRSAASTTGLAFAIMGLASAVASFLSGWASKPLGLRASLTLACLGAGLAYLPLLAVRFVPGFLAVVGVEGLFQGFQASYTNGLIAMITPRESHGVAYGVTQSASAITFGIFPLLAGVLASVFGVQSVFPAAAVTSFVIAVLVMRLLRRDAV